MNLFLLTLISTLTATALLSQNYVNIIDFKAKGDDSTINTQFIQDAIDYCHQKGGGTVTVPQGTFLTATIYLKSNVTLHLSEGAVLKGVGDMGAYKQGFRSNYALIYSEDQENISITGRGTIYGQGEHSAFQGGDFFNGIPNRPNTIFFAKCKHILLKDYIIRDGARWNMKFDNCVDIVLTNVSVFSHVVANNDGVNFDDCHNIRVSNCYFETGDDGICAKSYSDFGVKNMVVTNCIIKSSSNGFKLGAVSRGSFEDITFSNSTIYNTRLSGIAVQNADGSRIQRIAFNNITMHNVNGGIFLKVGARRGVKPGIIKDVIISNIVADGVGCWLPDTTQHYFKKAHDSRIGVGLAGHSDSKIENVTFSNVSMQFAGGGTFEHSKIVMEDKPNVYPEYNNWGITPAYAFNCRHVKNINFNNVTFDFIEKDERPAIFFEDAEEVILNCVKSKIDDAAKAFYRCKDVNNFFIINNKPQQSNAPFLLFEGEVNDITIMNNDFEKLNKVYIADKKIDPEKVKMKNNILR